VLLASAARLVKPGGRLVYATCSILDDENRGVAEAFLAAHSHFRLLPAAGVLEKERIDLKMGEYFEVWPHVHGTDGFFAAVFERAA
jgi:16S rRNA (cytosine967-C5)-methyltransferase